jgi:hypothetical protein
MIDKDFRYEPYPVKGVPVADPVNKLTRVKRLLLLDPGKGVLLADLRK